MTDWNDCYSGGMGNLRYPDEVIVQTIHHLGLGAYHARKALDLGCGSGRHLEVLHKRGYEVWAVDAADQALKMVQSKWDLPGVHTVNMRFPPVKFPDGFMDLVLMVNVLEHNLGADRTTIVDEVHRVLRDGGMFLSRHAGWMGGPPPTVTRKIELRTWERDRDTIIHLATEDEMLEVMDEAGFTSINVGSRRGCYPWLPWQDESEIYVVAVK